MDRSAAIAEIQRLFGLYRSARPGDQATLQALTDGKLYELYVLSEVVDTLAQRGFSLAFPFTSLNFKSSPGKIKLSDPHFEVRVSAGASSPDYRIFVDIEFDTLGHATVGASDNSRRHEIDIVVTTATSGFPTHSEIALAVECKAVAKFKKGLLKEALGVRREMSLMAPAQQSALSQHGGVAQVNVPASPPSEFWLAFIDPKGTNYAASPTAFGIELRHLEP